MHGILRQFCAAKLFTVALISRPHVPLFIVLRIAGRAHVIWSEVY